MILQAVDLTIFVLAYLPLQRLADLAIGADSNYRGCSRQAEQQFNAFRDAPWLTDNQILFSSSAFWVANSSSVRMPNSRNSPSLRVCSMMP